MKTPSTLPEDPAPSASLDHLKAQAAPTQATVQPQPLGSLPWPQELASGRPKVEDLSLSTTRNAGSEGSLVLEKVRDQDFGFGWNAATDTYGDLLDMGVIDPATVTMQAILNSCSIAASVLTTSALITEVPEEDPNGGMGGGMGDMM